MDAVGATLKVSHSLRLKVVLSVEALTPVLTGIGRYAWELASRMPSHLGAECVRFYRQGRWVKDPGALLQSEQVSAHPSTRAGMKWPQWPDWVRRGFAQHRLRQVEGQCRGHVFHGPNYFLPPCADLGVATVHDLSIFKYPQTHPLERIKHFEREFEQSISRAVHLITDSEATRLEVIDYLAWAPEKITAVALGVSNLFMPAQLFNAPILTACLRRYGLVAQGYTLCVSTLEPRKKIERLLQAYQCLPARLRARYPLVLVGGSGWLSDDLHQDIERFSGQGWLRYLGFVSEADLPCLYAGACTFTFPSIYEGFGLPVLEAMASGVPVVASNRSSLPEVTQGAALLIDPDDITNFAANLVRSLEDEHWREAAIQRGLAVSRDRTWDQCVEKTAAVYKKIMA